MTPFSSIKQKGSHNSMRWPLSALLLAMTIAASALGTITVFWDESHPNHSFLLGGFILLICVCATAAVFGTTTLRGAYVGASLFGGAYLVFVLHCGFGLETIHDSEWLARNTKLGFPLFGIAFLMSMWLQMISWPRSNPPSAQAVVIDSSSQTPAVGPTVSGETSTPVSDE